MNETIKVLLAQRSIRKFTGQEIEQEKLQEIKLMAALSFRLPRPGLWKSSAGPSLSEAQPGCLSRKILRPALPPKRRRSSPRTKKSNPAA